MNPPAGPVPPWMMVVPPPRIIVLSSDAFTEARCEKMSAADPTPIVNKSSTTISHRLASFNRPSMFPSSAQPLGAGRASGHGLPPHFCCVVVLPFYSSERLHNPPPRPLGDGLFCYVKALLGVGRAARCLATRDKG